MSTPSRLRSLLALGWVAFMFGYAAWWGGFPRQDALLWIGVAVLVGIYLGFGFMAWWLFLSPTSSRDSGSSSERDLVIQQAIGSLVLVGGMALVTGGAWDEIWHRRFGLGAVVKDFFWPPHILIYASLTIIALCVVFGIGLLANRAGGIRERFRRSSLLGILALVATAQVVALPADAFWHKIYGLDLTAWSLPHLVVLLNFGLLMSVATLLLAGVPPRTGWQGWRGIRANEVAGLFAMAFGATGLLQVGATEWDAIFKVGQGNEEFYRQVFWQRPEWLYPVVVATIALFSAVLTQRLVRRTGAATLVGLIVIVLRVATVTGLGGWQANLGLLTYALCFPVFLVLDIWQARVVRNSENAWLKTLGYLLTAGIFLTIALPVIGQWMVYPRINEFTVPRMIFFGLLVAPIVGWTADTIGQMLTGLSATAEQPRLAERPARTWSAVSFGGLAGTLALVSLMVLLAKAPV
jgi:hypothetical protein